MAVSGQPTLTYTWDAANRLTQISQAAGSANDSTAQTVGFSYDNANRRTVTTLANGSTVNYTYDNANEITAISYQKADTTVIGNLAYTYDNDGRRIQTSRSLASVNLPSAITSTSYNANNQLTGWGSATYGYDNDGNLTSDGTNTYTWDERNHLASLSGGVTASFAYDGIGRRIGRTVGSTTTGYVYDGLNYVQEKDGIGSMANITATLITGLPLDETYARMTGTGGSAVIQHFLPDANNNMIALLSSSQSITDSYTFEAYGNTTQTAGSSTQSQQYTGRENDGTGLYYYRARYYIPGGGSRFISEDPLGLAAGPNVYGYVNQDPINFNDPKGKLGAIAWGAEAGAEAGSAVVPGVGTAIGAAIGIGIAWWATDKAENLIFSNFPPGYWSGPDGAAEWGRRNGCGAAEGKQRFHQGVKQSDPLSGPLDNYGVNPDTGDVIDPEGESIGNLGEQ